MANSVIMTVTVPEKMDLKIKGLVVSGAYRTKPEVVVAALRSFLFGEQTNGKRT